MQVTANKVSVNGRDIILSTNATPYYLNQLKALKGKLRKQDTKTKLLCLEFIH